MNIIKGNNSFPIDSKFAVYPYKIVQVQYFTEFSDSGLPQLKTMYHVAIHPEIQYSSDYKFIPIEFKDLSILVNKIYDDSHSSGQTYEGLINDFTSVIGRHKIVDEESAKMFIEDFHLYVNEDKKEHPTLHSTDMHGNYKKLNSCFKINKF